MKLRKHIGAATLAIGCMLAMPLTASAADLPPLSHSLTRQAPKPAPALKLKDLDGAIHDLAHLKGKVVLINFWATWCPPCRREMPSMERLSQALKGEAFAVLAVDVGEDADTIQSFTSQLDTRADVPHPARHPQPCHASLESGRTTDYLPGRQTGTHHRQRHRRARVRPPGNHPGDSEIAGEIGGRQE